MTDFENTIENCDFCGYAYHIKSPEWYGWYEGWDAAVCKDCHDAHEAELERVRTDRKKWKVDDDTRHNDLVASGAVDCNDTAHEHWRGLKNGNV